MEDILDQAGIRRSLIAHRQKHPEPLSAREHADAMGVSLETAAPRRRKMVAAGLLRSEEGVTEKMVPYVRTWLTPEGVHVADHEVAAEEWAKKARERKQREKKD